VVDAVTIDKPKSHCPRNPVWRKDPYNRTETFVRFNPSQYSGS
jgi:hypothetical protein